MPLPTYSTDESPRVLGTGGILIFPIMRRFLTDRPQQPSLVWCALGAGGMTGSGLDREAAGLGSRLRYRGDRSMTETELSGHNWTSRPSAIINSLSAGRDTASQSALRCDTRDVSGTTMTRSAASLDPIGSVSEYPTI
jgi:hypothetical protein